MDLESIVQFLDNKTLLVTGATGYLAKVFVEKVLRVQPNVKKIYLLLRAPDASSAADRLLNEVVQKDLFRVIREKQGPNMKSFISEKLTAVAGDVSLHDMGVNDTSLKEKLWREVDIVVNSAANTVFDERYDVALGLNTLGALHLLNFAKKCDNIQMLLHVSTAYVCGEDAGLILEKPWQMGKAKNANTSLDIEQEKKLVEERLKELQSENATQAQIASSMKDLGIERARLHGWPNTYVFTKAMGEMILMHLKEDMPLVILRPTMITSTYKEPFPGWIEGAKTIDGIIVGYAKGKVTCFISNPQSILDVIPADMVVNAIVVAMVARASKKSSDDAMIYHIGSSFRNPVKFSDLHEFSFRYFTQNPWISKDGTPVKINKGTVLSSMSKFYTYMAIRFILPLKALKLVNSLLLQKYQETCTVLDRKIQLVMRLVDLYKPYVFFEGIFDDTNSEKLRQISEKSHLEANSFTFDPKNINWKNYIMEVHIPGLVKYAMR